MFKATLSNTDLLKNSISVISEILDEGTFKVDANGISLVSPDRTMVAVVDFRLLSTAFDEFVVESPVDLGMNIQNFMSVLKRVKGADKLTLQSTGKGKLEIIVEKDGKRKFELPLLDINSEKPPIDQLAFSGKIHMDSSVFEEGIEDASVVSDSIVMEAGPDSFKLSAKGDISTAQLEMKKGDNGILSIEAQQNIRARYPIDYLKKMIKACKLSKQTTLEFGTDYPLRISLKDIDKVHLNFILAPRVEE